MRPTSWLHLATALLVVASLPACMCQRRDPATETPIAELQGCEEDERCETGLCDSVQGGARICLRTCTQGCRGSDICTLLADNRYACVPERAGLCKTCETDADCPQPADRCLVLGTTKYCGRDCSFDDTCPPTYRCGEATTVTGVLAPKQCQPTSGTCDCTAATAGQQVPCEVTNATGTCTGVSICRPPVGFDVCSARTPTAEACNNIDDDCNGMTDENLGDLTCGMGECQRAVSACMNGTPQPCVPGLPGSELCNGRDDNCNGMVDDGFNLQIDVANCGSCNHACVLTNAVPKCDMGACGIERCVAGWTDLDHVASNGCEYPCLPTDGGMEVCDGLDNDCDGVVDDGFDLVTDPNNCGQCNLSCSVSGNSVATYACVARTCGIATCVPGRGNCNQQYGDGCEVPLNTDVNHCGSCSVACNTPNATPSCTGGICGIASCAAGWANCNGLVSDGCEVNTQTSAANCGGCGTTCNAANANNTCSSGSCTFTCQTNWWNADNQASNGCEYACIRTAGGVEACDTIDNDCDNRIDEDFDLTSNSSHCGMCNRACSAPFASTSCAASTCGITACNAGRSNCNNQYVDGCEINTTSDLANCGACGAGCVTPNATPRCLSSVCGIQSCNAGFQNCNNQVSDGCEINTGTDLSHCGACNSPCNTPNATPRCLGGACGVQSCNAGFANCNGAAGDGCEILTTNDVNNCGGCNQACALSHANPRCVTSTCGIQSCQTGWTNCNGTIADGCEVNTGGTDIANCGGCGTACTVANATPRCTSGVCGLQTCNTGWANCNLQLSDGCEVNTNTSVTSCGGCGNICSPAHATPMCSLGTCGIANCQAGWTNLNGLAADGCEFACIVSNGGIESCDGLDNDCDGFTDEGFNLSGDLNNCGACGNVCSATNVLTSTCSGGNCNVAICAPGFTNCNGTYADGCEVNTNTSLTNCGGCGTQCNPPNSNPVCTAGTCQIQACIGTNRNCDGLTPNGCEVNINANVDACGLCGNICPTRAHASRSCSGTTCGYNCDPGWVDIDGAAPNGCEYQCSPSGVDDPDDSSVDQDCDGIDGTISKGIFVAIDGLDLNPGTRAFPKRTVQAGIAAASTLVPHVYVSEGTYDEAITLRSGISVYGGYSRNNNWARSASYSVILRNGVVASGRIVAVSGTSITLPTTVAYVTIRALDTVSAGASVYGLYCSSCNALTLRTTLVIAGSAGNGTSAGAGAVGDSGPGGNPGNNGSCDGANGGGGTGGSSTCGRPGGGGGAGGPEGNNAGSNGGAGVVGTPGGSGGSGCDSGCFGGCGASPGSGGANGSAGGAGTDAAGGTGGTIGGGFFISSSGNTGTLGSHGNGGGGGGGGGGQGGCAVNDGGGNGGGGGGAAGCAGGGASGGTGGGSSFGVFLFNSTGATLINNNISSGNAGGGGSGGSGGSGGNGGGGGVGATVCTGEVGAGGNGGAGGAGGRGGHGGGGAGGASYGVYRSSSTVTMVGNLMSAGNGGFGGPSPGNVGGNGASGALF